MTQSKIIIPGFQFAGIHCGIKDSARKKDLTLIYSEEPTTMVDGVFTRNKVVAAPVLVCKDVVKKGHARLVVINSGVANACTGERGLKDARDTQKLAAKCFDLDPSEVLVCSTGKIGDFLPMKAIESGIPKAQDLLSEKNFLEAVKGIMTTDQYPKYASTTGQLNGAKYHMAVLAKGAGMLRPDMATMLAYVVTDLAFTKKAMGEIFRRAVEVTLNRITVDGDTSTNDTVLILANGRANNKPIQSGSAAAKEVEVKLTALLEDMARKIALDGEGATKCCDVLIRGAKNEADAKKIAYAIGNSPLVKTALFGCDPNWGRIMAAVGYSGAQIIPEKIAINIGPHAVVRNGIGVKATQPAVVSSYIKKNKHMEISVTLGMGKGAYHVYMSDLTYDYVHLNAEYHT